MKPSSHALLSNGIRRSSEDSQNASIGPTGDLVLQSYFSLVYFGVTKNPPVKSPSPYWLFWNVAFGCFLLVLCRGYLRLRYAEIWAEDGSPFLEDALRDGWRSLFFPLAGSFHIVHRFLLFILSKALPVSLWATIICFASYAILALTAATVSRPSFAWLIPSTTARVLLALALCGTPGLTEMAGNLANTNWMMFLWLCLLGLKDPKVPFARWECFLAAVIIPSVATTILLLPLFLWRARHSARRDSGNIGVCTLLILLLAALIVLRVGGISIHQPNSPDQLTLQQLVALGPRAYLKSFFRSAVYEPWLGTGLTWWLIDSSVPWVTHFIDTPIRLTFLVFLFFWIRTNRREPWVVPLLLFLIGVSLWVVLLWFARPGSLFQIFQGSYSLVRYAFPIAAAGLVFWTAALRPLKFSLRGFPSSLASLFLILALFHSLRDFSYPPLGDPDRVDGKTVWQTWAPRLEGAILKCPARVSAPLSG